MKTRDGRARAGGCTGHHRAASARNSGAGDQKFQALQAKSNKRRNRKNLRNRAALRREKTECLMVMSGH